MTVSRDPAVEAAQRAWISDGVSSDDALDLANGSIAAEAAREVLKPIRATYARWESAFGGRRDDVSEMVQVLLEELAPLIYSTEELER